MNAFTRSLTRISQVEDIDLLEELVARCHERLDRQVVSQLDRQLIRHLYDAGKLILRRVHRNHHV